MLLVFSFYLCINALKLELNARVYCGRFYIQHSIYFSIILGKAQGLHPALLYSDMQYCSL